MRSQNVGRCECGIHRSHATCGAVVPQPLPRLLLLSSSSIMGVGSSSSPSPPSPSNSNGASPPAPAIFNHPNPVESRHAPSPIEQMRRDAEIAGLPRPEEQRIHLTSSSQRAQWLKPSDAVPASQPPALWREKVDRQCSSRRDRIPVEAYRNILTHSPLCIYFFHAFLFCSCPPRGAGHANS
jgi:hypothetical protein